MKTTLISLLLSLSPWPIFSFQSRGGINSTTRRVGGNRCSSFHHASLSASKDSYQVEITLDGKTSIISVKPGESILNALEQNSSQDFSVSFIPHECRRGNCLTCAGRHLDKSVSSNLVQKENGLSPEVSDALFEDGKYVLTCSSYVIGDGVKLELGANTLAWDVIYRNRLKNEEVERMNLEASAKAMRLAAERNVEQWKLKTERLLQLRDSSGDK